ncbi:MAG TPA: prolyl oligopeptidase family serine peptidase, partial [Polyangiaceae bacterium]
MQPYKEGETATVPYGSWKSPISSELIVRSSVSLGQLALDVANVFFTEVRPAEQGRTVLVRRARDGSRADVTPAGFNVRTRVHEYGGGDYLVSEGNVFFSNFSDQRVYRQDRGNVPRPITPEDKLRFADYQFDVARRRLVCVREDKRLVESREDVNTIVAIAIDGDPTGGRELVQGRDFYASPRMSADGSKLCWLCWDHPSMPWDAAELWVGSIDGEGRVTDAEHVAGGKGESIFQPEWAPDGTLYFVSDRSDFWNLHRLRDGVVEPVHRRSAEFGVPQWAFGMSTYAFVAKDQIICIFTENGMWHLAKLDTTSGAIAPIVCPYTWFSGVRAAGGRAVFLAGSPVEPSAVVELDIASGDFEVVRRSTDLRLDEGYLSVPQAVEFATEGGLTAHGFFYRPQNRDFCAPRGELPPLIVKSHGGPTGATSSLFSLAIQYWTSRGFAVLDVNYGGSTGYGRAYRERLKGKW